MNESGYDRFFNLLRDMMYAVNQGVDDPVALAEEVRREAVYRGCRGTLNAFLDLMTAEDTATELLSGEEFATDELPSGTVTEYLHGVVRTVRKHYEGAD